MEKLTRRDLIKQASVSAGVVGILATTAACASPDSTQNATSAASTNLAGGYPLAVFVTDPARGTLVIMNGGKLTTINHPDIAQSLLALK